MLGWFYLVLVALCAVGSIFFGQMARIEFQAKPRPEISMNVEVNLSDVFSSRFYVVNGGEQKAENVKVAVDHFDNIAKKPGFSETKALLSKLNESDNYSRFLGEIEKSGGKVDAKINDIVSYEDPAFAIAELGSGAKIQFDTTTVNPGESNPTIFVVPPEEKPYLESSLICFSVHFEWREKIV